MNEQRIDLHADVSVEPFDGRFRVRLETGDGAVTYSPSFDSETLANVRAAEMVEYVREKFQELARKSGHPDSKVEITSRSSGRNQ